MCAALGYWWAERRTEQVGEPPVCDDGWREGYILVPAAGLEAAVRPEDRKRGNRAPAPAPPPATWGYRATPAIAGRAATFELAETHNVLVRTVFRRNGQRIPHVRTIRPEDRIFILYRDRDRRDWLRAIVGEPSDPLPPLTDGRAFPAFGVVEDRDLIEYLEALGYAPDPEIGRFTVLPLSDVEHCDDPGGQPPPRNAIWRW